MFNASSRHSAIRQIGSASSMWSEPATKPSWPSNVTCKSIPTIAWWPMSWRRTGTQSSARWMKRSNNTSSSGKPTVQR